MHLSFFNQSRNANDFFYHCANIFSYPQCYWVFSFETKIIYSYMMYISLWSFVLHSDSTTSQSCQLGRYDGGCRGGHSQDNRRHDYGHHGYYRTRHRHYFWRLFIKKLNYQKCPGHLKKNAHRWYQCSCEIPYHLRGFTWTQSKRTVFPSIPYPDLMGCI